MHSSFTQKDLVQWALPRVARNLADIQSGRYLYVASYDGKMAESPCADVTSFCYCGRSTLSFSKEGDQEKLKKPAGAWR